MKFLAYELLEKTGVENFDQYVGAVSINIGGVPVNTRNHVIDVGESLSVDVIIGQDLHTVDIIESDETGMSEGLKAFRDAERDAIEAAEAQAATE